MQLNVLCDLHGSKQLVTQSFPTMLVKDPHKSGDTRVQVILRVSLITVPLHTADPLQRCVLNAAFKEVVEFQKTESNSFYL